MRRSSPGTNGTRRGGRWIIAAGVVPIALAGAAIAAAIAPPNDPGYPAQTAPGGALALIRHPGALAAVGSTPLAEVLVANLDTGLDLDHPEFAGRLATVPAGTPAPDVYGNPPSDPAVVPAGGSNGWDLIGSDAPGDGSVKPDADPSDPVGRSGHGTAVAGVLGAATGNGVGGAGVAPNARFLAIRSCWDNDTCFQSIQADATRWAAARGVRVISMSWACCEAAPGAAWGDGFDGAIQAASNTLFVAIPGGNGGAALAGENRRPCGDPSPNVLCVSTSSPTDGLDCGEYSPSIVDLAVPTQNSVTTINGGGQQATGCATSYAAPMAAGAAAVLLGLDPAAPPAVVKQALIDAARPAAAWFGRSVSGGILDLEAAVRLFAQRRGITLVPGEPPVTPTTPTTVTEEERPRVLPRVRPDRLTATGRRSGRSTFKVTGRLRLPTTDAALRTALCSARGQVTIKVLAGGRTLTTRRATLRTDCSYRVTIAFAGTKRFGRATPVRFSARFGGNPFVLPRSASGISVALARRG